MALFDDGCDPFTIELPVAPTASMLDRLRRELQSRGGTLHGNLESGSITAPSPVGTISSNYYVQGRRLAIVITDKPALVTCARIEQELRDAVAKIPHDVIDTHGETTKQAQRPSPPGEPTIEPVHVLTDVAFIDYDSGETVLVDRRPPALWPLLLLSAAVVGGVVLWRRA